MAEYFLAFCIGAVVGALFLLMLALTYSLACISGRISREEELRELENKLRGS